MIRARKVILATDGKSYPATGSTGDGYTIAAAKKVGLSIDLKPALSAEKLDRRLIREFAAADKKHFRTVMKNLLPKSLIPIVAALLKDLRLTVKRPRPFEEAIITRGGIEMKEIDPRTMGSSSPPRHARPLLERFDSPGQIYYISLGEMIRHDHFSP